MSVLSNIQKVNEVNKKIAEHNKKAEQIKAKRDLLNKQIKTHCDNIKKETGIDFYSEDLEETYKTVSKYLKEEEARIAKEIETKEELLAKAEEGDYVGVLEALDLEVEQELEEEVKDEVKKPKSETKKVDSEKKNKEKKANQQAKISIGEDGKPEGVFDFEEVKPEANADAIVDTDGEDDFDLGDFNIDGQDDFFADDEIEEEEDSDVLSFDADNFNFDDFMKDIE